MRRAAFLFSILAAGLSGQQTDPFADLPVAPSAAPQEKTRASWTENFGFRREIMSQFDTTEDGRPASRQSLGFEILKKFSSRTSTFAAFNMQGRLVRRDRYNGAPNEMEGADRPGWAFEYHNLYVDFYNVFNPLMGDEGRGRNVGRFNFRAGRFYVPFGLNLQTDTHGTVLQLSNDRNFGFERDWYTGFYGSINRHLNYDAYYLAGSGYDLKFKGQSGMAGVRLSLGSRYLSEYGLEGGVSVLAGERLAAPMGGMEMGEAAPLKTQRVGIDGRFRRNAPGGLLTFTNELSGGRDARDTVFTQLHGAEYLHRSRRWGVATQFRRFTQDGRGADSSILGEFTWYFRNDVGNSNIHWLKLNFERRIERASLWLPHNVLTLQYYFYK
jgi:hypothetical protein